MNLSPVWIALPALLAGAAIAWAWRRWFGRALPPAYGEALASVSDGIAIYDAQLRCREWNQGMVVLTGISAGAARGAAFFETFPAATGIHFETLFRQALAGSVVSTPDILCLGHTLKCQFWCQGILSPITKAGGKVQGVAAIFRDISARKQAELALQNERLLVNDVLDSIPAPVYFKNSSGIFLGCNQAACRMLGISRKDLIGKTVGDFTPADVADHHTAIDLELIKNGGAKEYEMAILDGDGRTHDVLVHKTVFQDTQGKVAGIVGVMLEVTKLKRAEEALQESQDQLNRIISAAQDAVIMIDPGGLVSLWNESAARVFGHESPAAIGQPLHKLIIPERFQQDCLRQFARISCARHSTAPGQFAEVTAARANGEEFPIELSLSPVQIRGDWHLLGIVRDITERRRAAQALEEMNSDLERATLRANELAVQAELASAAKSEFLANMSHEIRTPMNGVIGMTQLLLNTALSPEQRQFVLLLRDSGQALLSLINDILDFSKIEARKLSLEALDFNLETTLEDTAELLALKAQDKGLELVCYAESATPLHLCGDPSRLRQVLLNLGSNAIKFTAQGGVTISASVVESDERGALVRFAVKDTGIGIPAEKQGMLFSPFTQVDGSTTRKYGGTGLGLAISKQLAELMGGQIGLESKEGQGSTFWFTARLARQATEPAPVSNAALKGIRVLVVDGHTDSRAMLKVGLERCQCRYGEASRGELAAYELARANTEGDPYRLVLLDMRSLGGDSVALGKQLQTDPAFGETRLVMMGGINQVSDAPRLEKMGFAGFVAKPFRQAQLRECLEAALRGKAKTATPSATSREAGKKAVKSGPRRTVLLAEDNPINQMVAIKMLEHEGCRVEVAANGQEAIDAMKRRAYDLVLMDCQMPELDGLEATRRIRNGEPGIIAPQVPIIALTARALQGDREKCLQAGMNDYLTKPLEIDQLQAILKRWQNPEAAAAPAVKMSASAPASASTAAVSEPVGAIFDRADLLRRVMNDESLAAAMIESFVADTPIQIKNIQESLAANDAAACGKLAHRLKGAAASMGAPAFRQIASEMETAGRDGNLAQVKELFPVLEKQYAALKKCLQPDW